MQQKNAITVVEQAVSDSSRMIARAARALIEFTVSQPSLIPEAPDAGKKGCLMVENAKSQDSNTDPRVYFAAERTLLAWIRTGLALMGFGFVVARFGLFLREIASVRPAPQISRPGLSLWIGTALVILGVMVTLSAAAKHWRTVRRLEQAQPLLFRPLSLGTVVAILLGLLGLVTATYLLFGL